jgi:KTSC domain
MITKKLIRENIIDVLYESSNVLTSTFNTQTKELEIIFKNGGKYKYNGVTTSDYTRFEISESQGTAFTNYIKKYPTEKLGSVDTTLIVNELNAIITKEKNDELYKLYLQIVHDLNIICQYNKPDEFNRANFDGNIQKVSKSINQYIQKIITNEKH